MRILDCFTYLNEEELLELRIKLLYDKVDQFIIAEGNRTFSGEPKNFNCKKVLDKLGIPQDKILVLEVDLSDTNDALTRKKRQQDEIGKYIEYGDVAFVTDCDEIMNPEFINYYVMVSKNSPNNILRIPLANLIGQADYEIVNDITHLYVSGFVCQKHHINLYTLSELRALYFTKDPVPFASIFTYDDNEIKKAGWHFNLMGGKERIKSKLKLLASDTNIDSVNKYSIVINLLDENNISVVNKISGDNTLKKYDRTNLPRLIFQLPNVEKFLFSKEVKNTSSMRDIVVADNTIAKDKSTNHSYIEGFYEKEFEKFKDKHIKLCEIGIQTGSSMALWNSYFNNAKILGIDIDKSTLLEQFSAENFNNTVYIYENAYNENLVNFLGTFDIIIDDGPHTLETQQKFIDLYLPKLNKGGLLIIEDVQNPAWFEELIKVLPPEYKNSYECIDLRHLKNRYDDLMFVVRK